MTDAMPKEIAEAVIAMMVKVGYVQKKGENTFQNYKYASIEAVLEKVQPALADVGLVIVQSESSSDIVGDGNLMKATYDFSLQKGGLSWGPIQHSALSAVRNSKGGYDDKALNKCHTAARKYFILGLFQIPTGLAADPDEDEDRPAQPSRAPAPPPAKSAPRTVAPVSTTSSSPAEDFVKRETAAIKALSSLQAIDQWETTKKARLNELRQKHPDQANILQDVLDECRAKLSPVREAAE